MSDTIIEGAGGLLYHYPRMVVIVTARANGKDNAMTVAWHSPISVKPPLYGISITTVRFTYDLILESKEFAINFLPFESAELFASVGGCKGREIDKFERFNMAKAEPSKISAPILKDAYASYECLLADHRPCGDHEWVVGEIVATQFSEEVFSKDGIIDLRAVNPSLFMGAELYGTVAKEPLKHLDRKIYGRGRSD